MHLAVSSQGLGARCAGTRYACGCMRKQETKTIEDQEGSISLTCTQHGAIPGMRLLARLGKILGPAIGDLRAITGAGGSDMLPALSGLLERLDEDTLESLICDLLSGCQAVANKRVYTFDTQSAINDVYSGRYHLLLKSLGFSLQVNFAVFLRGVGGTSPSPSAPAAPVSATEANPST